MQLCCLVCEDQALIGIALQADLKDEGYSVAGPFATGAEALAWTERHTPDVAILDYKLRDGGCTELVGLLLARGVPVIMYSGWPTGPDMPRELRGVPWLQKPTDPPRLLDALARLAPLLSSRGLEPAIAVGAGGRCPAMPGRGTRRGALESRSR